MSRMSFRLAALLTAACTVSLTAAPQLARQRSSEPPLAIVATSTAQSDLEQLRQQFVGYYTAAGASRGSQRMIESLEGLEWHAKSLSAPGYLLSDGSWTDINYAETPSGTWGPWDHSRRLIVLARAYQTPGQSLYRNATLRAQIDAALAYTKRFYGATVYPAGNWWFWTIGIPIDLGPTLILMRGEINQQVYDDLVFAIHLRIGSSTTSKGIVGPVPTGQNLVWSAFTHLCLALLKDDPPMLTSVRGAMASVTLPTAGEGIKADRSFHQHGAQLYTGGYGGSFANEVGRYSLITRGTPWQLPPDSLESFIGYVADGVAWSLFGNYFDVAVVSREIARPTTTGYNGLAALLQLSEVDSPRVAEIRAAARKMLLTWYGLPTEIAALAAKLENSPQQAAWPSGHRHFFASDYTVHRRPNWFASVKMFSSRIRSGERTNGENTRGSRLSDGRFYLVLSGNEYMGRDVWPALDWTRLPGITVEQKADTANDAYGYGTRSFAGGTGNGRGGVSAMELAPLNSALSARKSWFFFDDAIVFLTNSIKSLSTNRIETIVNQWPLVNPSSQLVRQHDWAVLENVGYWFPSPVELKVTTESRTGSWAELGASSDGTVHNRTFVTMWLDHGTSPTNASAEYVIVPGVSAAQMSAWSASRPLSILANNDAVSAVRDLRNDDLGITFWRAGNFQGFESNSAAVVFVTTSRDAMQLHVADPNSGILGSFQLTLPGDWLTKDVPSVRHGRSTTLTIQRAAGKTTSVSLKAPPSKRRSVG
jgi:chondroitin AC lyase